MRAVPLLVLLVLTACSSGKPDTVAAEPATELEVRLVATQGGTAQTWTLTCDPTGGDHPDPDQACADLTREPTPFAPLSGELCTEVFGGPQTAVVRGTYRGDPVALELSRSDGCRTAQWDRLGAVLPATP